MRSIVVFLAVLVWTGSAAAQPNPAEAARAALEQMQAATDSLQEAETARDRVRALTVTIRAYEVGLAAMRDGLRRAATRETALSRQLQAREGEISRLLGVLLTIETTPPPVAMLHPTGPVGAARSAMMLAEVTPALQIRADQLRDDLEEVQVLRQLQSNAVSVLQDGLGGVQKARAELSQAIANRTDLPRRFTEDPVRTAILISSAETLAGFASGLSEISNAPIPEADTGLSVDKGALELPVQGVLLHRAGGTDAAGVRREGMILATRPRALVTSPAAATIRYLGPLLDLGNVVILEPKADTLLVLSGLDEVFGETGEVISEGAPVGLMGGSPPEIGAILSLSGDGTGTDRSETLYIEVRENGRPVDPETWFRTDKDG